MRKAPHKTVKRFSRNGLYLNLHPARQSEHDPVLYGGELRDVEFPVRVQLVHHPDERGLDLILGQVRCLTAGLVFELMIALPDHPAVFVVAVPDLRAVPPKTVCFSFVY